MSGIWNRTLVYLGLREEPEEMYDDLPERFVPEDDPHAEHAPERPSSRSLAGTAAKGTTAQASSRTSRTSALAVGAHNGVPPSVSGPEGADGSTSDRAGSSRGSAEGRGDGRGRGREARAERPRVANERGVAESDDNVRSLRTGSDVLVRAVPSSPVARVAVIQIEVFDDVEAVGARYRTGQPVLFDVSGSDRATGRRVVDFVSGMTFALRGRLTKVGTGAFLLVPDGVDLPADERRRLDDLGYRLPTGSDG